MSGEETPSSTELALLRGELMTALARIEGVIQLVHQEQQQGTRRLDELAADHRRLDDRVDVLERTSVPRTELEADRKERRADRRIVIGSALTAALSLLVVIVGGAIMAALGLK